MVTKEENLENRKELIAESGLEPVEFAFERAIGNNDSVYSNFCELIIKAKEKVGRIVVKDGVKNRGFATGFMVSERLLLTNWHVFQTQETVMESEVEFFYELNIFGRPNSPTTFKLAANDFFFSSKELDYCLVAVQPTDITGQISLSSIGYHYLNPAKGKLADEGKELLNIIHHPDGDFKQLSIRENTFISITPTTIWYKSDTAPGSSGSPVFNDQWQVVALHHMGIPCKTTDGKHYLDKDGKIIELIDGKIDLAKIHWIANEGIRISVLLKDIFTKFPDNQFIKGVQVEPPALKGTPIVSPIRNEVQYNAPIQGNAGDVQISFPASLVQTNGQVTIQINNNAIAAPLVGKPEPGSSVSMDSLDNLLEIKRIERENAIDYSDCKGYIADFLGVHIPMPKPKKKIQHLVSKLKNSNDIVLDYYHYSVIHHAIRKMPVISAINVDGDPAKRLDEFERKDIWLRDNRIDYDVQLDDKFYAKSGFDKGHMSRREDADWGDSAELAKKYADMTCMHTNACPQVPAINQSKKGGLWGKLEILLLEKGAGTQQGEFAKISVFNGPVFAETDSVYKSVQIPMDFWKIILWLGDDGKPKATGFLLSQTTLVGDIDFEALDIHQNLEFKPFQVSIKSLEKLTQLDFSAIKKFDTFKASDSSKPIKLETVAEVEMLLA